MAMKLGSHFFPAVAGIASSFGIAPVSANFGPWKAENVIESRVVLQKRKRQRFCDRVDLGSGKQSTEGLQSREDLDDVAEGTEPDDEDSPW